MDFTGTGRKLGADDVARAAAAIGCDEAAVRAVLRIEARGAGFDGRLRPTMLREPHVFYRNLPSGKVAAAVDAGLAWRLWRPGAYADTSDERYAELARAVAIDEEAALKSCSWGLGQVLGENHAMVGFSTARAMVDAMKEGEGRQLDAMVAFILEAGLGPALRRRDFDAFALGYNGKAAARHDYGGRLRVAYDAYRAAGPPSGPTPALVLVPPGAMLRVGDRGDAVRALQSRLYGLGHLRGAIDGDFGPITEQAVKRYQRTAGLVADGIVGSATGRALGLAGF